MPLVTVTLQKPRSAEATSAILDGVHQALVANAVTSSNGNGLKYQRGDGSKSG